MLKRANASKIVIEEREGESLGAGDAPTQTIRVNFTTFENKRLERGYIIGRTDARWL